MAQRLLTPGPLLDEKGNLCEAGYAFSLVKHYDRDAIKAGKSRIKEWDYYYIGNADYGLALTVADNGYMSMASVSILEYGLAPFDNTKSIIGLFPMGKLHMPSDSRMGDVVFENKKKGFSLKFLHQGDKRRLLCYMENFDKSKRTFRCDITLMETVGKSMVIATPWKKAKHFYYNQKINNLLAGGYAKVGEKTYDFNKDSFGVLDWGRGVWTYKNTWLWSSLSAKQGDHTIGFNLGYGFGDNHDASENMFFYDGEAHKLGDIKIDIPMKASGKDDFMGQWIFRSVSGEVEMLFTPKYDRHADTNLLVLRSNQHQVFGTFNGVIRVDGKEYPIENLPGFAEKVYNRW
ncbi:MAG: DUF2804 domain-containing protein [Erysipelotrichaceae bacterium]|nr:DUF2804 domain-containing protein [Erysipelotrichaceae bacterium]